ncbi:hypothetical protein HUJ04_001675 [Dendroctonus ponderosae]|nr:hypothetical protein HUJ04_001675 [Dendroctonus ponderosae]
MFRANIGYTFLTSTLILLVLCLIQGAQSAGQIIYAVNAGGEAHTDSNGIRYERDPLAGKVGIASDYGKFLVIGRVPANDHILYQTERYHTSTFGYDLSLPGDGSYVLVLKFCEVYFEAPNQKVFDVVLNEEHTVVADLDIFGKVDKGVAHDEYVEFEINAFYLMKGAISDVPQLPPIVPPEERNPDLPKLDLNELEEESKPQKRPRNIPTMPESYEPEEESSIMLPVFIVIGAFIPILFFLCKL